MVCLGIDTSGETLNIGLSRQGRVIGERTYHGEHPHSVVILSELEALLSESRVAMGDLGLVAVTGGPGRYTALRVGMATAKGLAVTLGIPMVRISSLEALAHTLLPREGHVIPLVDARRRLVYYARFVADGDRLNREEEDQALPYTEAASRIPRRAALTGDGVPLVRPLLGEREKGISMYPGKIRGGTVARLGERKYASEGRDELYDGPTYIRGIEIKGASFAPKR